MKRMKKIISVALCMALLLCLPLGASAATFDGTDEYIRFISGNKRLNSEGYFEFYIKQWVNTDVFTANSTTLRIDTFAQIKDGSATHTDSSVEFTMTLYKANGEVAGSYIGKADGIYGGKSFTVVKGAKYYIKISVESGSLYGNERLDGYGNVTPIIYNK